MKQFTALLVVILGLFLGLEGSGKNTQKQKLLPMLKVKSGNETVEYSIIALDNQALIVPVQAKKKEGQKKS